MSPPVPSPLRCFRCQRFGHSKNNCTKEEICRNCSQATHGESCSQTPKCVNCGEGHPSSSKKCPVWIQENEIQKVKTVNKCSFSEAKSIVSANAASSRNYAQIASMNTETRNSNLRQSSQVETRLIQLVETLEKRIEKLETVIELLLRQLSKQGQETGSPVPATENGDKESTSPSASGGSSSTSGASASAQVQSAKSSTPSGPQQEELQILTQSRKPSQVSARPTARSIYHSKSGNKERSSTSRSASRSRTSAFGADGFTMKGALESRRPGSIKMANFLHTNRFGPLKRDDG